MSVFGHYETYYLKLIKGQKQDPLSQLLLAFLNLFSRVYYMAISARNWAYDKGYRKIYHPPVPIVMSVGNIVCGGTGKTPVTLKLAKEFSNEYKVAILSRGYRSRSEKMKKPIKLGEEEASSPLICGDEPYMLFKNLPEASVYVGKDRRLSAKMAVKSGTQMILLDDGMQHRRLARDIDIVVLDGREPLGNGYLLPRGLLREGIRSLKRADLIVVNHLEDIEIFSLLKERLSLYTKAPFVGMRVKPLGLYDQGNNSFSIEKGKKVAVFCGLGKPEYFLETIEGLGLEVVDHHFFRDHEIDMAELDIFAETCQKLGVDYLVCTEKDVIKCETLKTKIPIIWLKMELEIIEGQQYWKSLIDKAKSDMKKRIYGDTE